MTVTQNPLTANAERQRRPNSDPASDECYDVVLFIERTVQWSKQDQNTKRNSSPFGRRLAALFLLESGAQLQPISEEEASTEREKITSAAGESKRKTLKRNTAAKSRKLSGWFFLAAKRTT
jgi:hypothetical protein